MLHVQSSTQRWCQEASGARQTVLHPSPKVKIHTPLQQLQTLADQKMKERLKLNVMPLPVKPVIWGHYIKKSTQYPFWLRMMDVFIKAYVWNSNIQGQCIKQDGLDSPEITNSLKGPQKKPYFFALAKSNVGWMALFHLVTALKTSTPWTSLEHQWLRTCLPM